MLIFSGSGSLTNLCTAPGTYCEVSSSYPGYPCQSAIDGIVEHGPRKEWASAGEHSGAWIKVCVIRKIEKQNVLVNVARGTFNPNHYIIVVTFNYR